MIEFAPRSKNEMTYDEALLYCQFLEHNGHRDWRMPTFTEWIGGTRMSGSWYYMADGQYPDSQKLIIVPVRDV